MISSHRQTDMRRNSCMVSQRVMVFVLAAMSGCQQSASDSPKARPTVGTIAPAQAPAKVGAAASEKPATSPMESQPAPAPAIEPTKPPASKVEEVVRENDVIPELDSKVLEATGLRKLSSDRLTLVTDCDAPDVANIPAHVDGLYAALENYFGPLPPARNRQPYQTFGYLIVSASKFREAGLIPETLPPFDHGRNLRNQFWLNDQKFDYYRRHLLFHEFVHCYTSEISGGRGLAWYFEGVAELFATHGFDPQGKIVFGIMPLSPRDAAGFGRITLIKKDIAANRAKKLGDVFEFQWTDYKAVEPYAWSWAACYFLATHPHYREAFQSLSKESSTALFKLELVKLFTNNRFDLETEWALFTHTLDYGYDLPRAVIDFQPGEILPIKELQIDSSRGWQSARVILEPGKTYRITAQGEVVLARTTRPWVSTPDGISIQYSANQPLGQLIGTLRPTEPGPPDQAEPMLKSFVAGRSVVLKPDVQATLYLRVNDNWNQLADNEGTYQVVIERDDSR